MSKVLAQRCRLAAGSIAASCVLPAVSVDGEGRSGRRGATDALGDAARTGDCGGTGDRVAEGLQAVDSAGAVEKGADAASAKLTNYRLR